MILISSASIWRDLIAGATKFHSGGVGSLYPLFLFFWRQRREVRIYRFCKKFSELGIGKLLLHVISHGTFELNGLWTRYEHLMATFKE